jgi:hypothetical protein
MRASSALLGDTGVRLWELVFPIGRPLLVRTRVPYVDVEGLIAFSKRDRDGKVDAYLAAFLPDEVALVYFLGGEVVNATLLTPIGRFAVPITQALQHIHAEEERSEVAFHQVPREQLAAMYASCTQPALEPPLAARSAEAVFRALFEQKFSGTLELISNGRVNYVQVKEGRFAGGHFSDQRPDEPPAQYLARLFTSVPPAPLPKVVARAYPGVAEVPLQATPAMVAMFRSYFWGLTDQVEAEHKGEGARRAERARQRLLPDHPVLQSFGGLRTVDASDPLTEPEVLAEALAAWTSDLLAEMEVINPGCAPRMVRDAARDNRFAFNAVGFFKRLPWRIEW